MAFALVKAGTLNSANLNASFGQATTAGNLLISWLSSNDSASVPWTTTSPGWTQVNSTAAGGPFGWCGVWFKLNCAAGETAPVFTDGGGASAWRSMLAEFSGGATSSQPDSSSSATGFSTVTGTNAAPDAVAGDLIIWNATWTGNGALTTIVTTMADSSGASVTPNETQDAGANSPQMNMSYAWGIAGSTGSSQDTAASTLGEFSGGSGVIASFSPVSITPVTVYPAGKSLPNFPARVVTNAGWRSAGHSR